MADVIGGQTHIAVRVAMNGSMWVEYPTFYGRPSKDQGFWWIRIEKKRQPLSETGCALRGFRSVSDYGLNPTRRYNHHRVFKFNSRNHQILADLVKRQDLVSYLTLIGVEDPHGTIMLDKKNFREHQKWESMMDEYRDDQDDLDYWWEDEFEEDTALN